MYILKCPSQAATLVWDKSMDDLKVVLVENRTCPGIAPLLVHDINQWREGEKVTMIKDHEFDGVQDIFGDQVEIECRPLLVGVFQSNGL